MKKLLTIAFFLCSLFSFGQPNGAATPDSAWADSIPNQWWFELETDINVDGDAWVSKSSNSKIINFNRDDVNNYAFSFFRRLGNQQNTYDYSMGDFGYDPPYDNYCFEEWFIIRIPSTRYLRIEVNFPGTISGIDRVGGDWPSPIYDNTIQFYEVIDSIDLSSIDFTTDDSSIDLFHYFFNSPDYNILENSFELSENENIPSDYHFSKNANFIFLRIGNNDNELGVEGDMFITDYEIRVSTTNNLCESALKFPDINEVFNDTTNSTYKNLLNANDEIDNSFYVTDRVDGVRGSDEIVLPSSSPGMWFSVTTEDTALYFSTCGSQSPFNPQLLVFDACPDSGGVVLGAENDNLFIGDNLNGGTDVCLDDPSNIFLPVVKDSTGASSMNPKTLYAYLFGYNGSMGYFNFHITRGNDGILPVEWLDFSGKPLSKSNQLYWSTASETQNDHFLLEKSIDGENYFELASIPGSGNSAFEKHYEFIDEQAFETTYYRIAQVDWDGTLNRGPEIVVLNESIYAQFSILNNPIQNGKLRIKCSSLKSKEVTMDVFSMNGQNVFSAKLSIGKGDSVLSIDLPALNDGIYLLKISDFSTDYTQKISIQSTN